MSTTRNHGPKRRVRDFARRSGFTYQHAQLFLAHFDSLNSTRPDESGMRLLVVLCSDIRVNDWTFTESEGDGGIEGTEPWRTDTGHRVVDVELVRDLDGDEVHVRGADGLRDTCIAHAQTLIYRPVDGLKSEGKPSATDTLIVKPAPNLNRHLGLKASGGGLAPGAAILRELGIVGSPAPSAAREGANPLHGAVLQPSQARGTLPASLDSTVWDVPHQNPTHPNPATARVTAGLGVGAFFDRLQNPTRPFAMDSVWTTADAVVVDAAGHVAIDARSSASLLRGVGHMILVTIGTGDHFDIEVHGPRRTWAPADFALETTPTGQIVRPETGDAYLPVGLVQDRTKAISQRYLDDVLRALVARFVAVAHDNGVAATATTEGRVTRIVAVPADSDNVRFVAEIEHERGDNYATVRDWEEDPNNPYDPDDTDLLDDEESTSSHRVRSVDLTNGKDLAGADGSWSFSLEMFSGQLIERVTKGRIRASDVRQGRGESPETNAPRSDTQ